MCVCACVCLEKITQKCKYECDYLTSRHKLTLNGLLCHYNQIINQSKLHIFLVTIMEPIKFQYIM